jgi:hypothetical protein
MGGHPAGAVLGQGASGPQAMEGAVGIARLVPGGQDHGGAEVTAQVLRTTREEALAAGAAQPGPQEPCVGQDEDLEGVRHGPHGVEGGGRQSLCALRIALQAARRTPLCLPAAWGRTTGKAGVAHLLLRRRDPRGLPVGGARKAQDGGDRPRWPAWPHAVAPRGSPSATPSRANRRWTVARGRRVRGRDRGVVSRVRWPRRRGRVCRATPASNRCGAKPGRKVWRPVPWVLPAPRLAGASRLCTVARDRGAGRSWPGKRHSAGRSRCQEGRRAVSRRAARRVERS